MTDNTPAPLTRDFLQASKDKVVFRPDTLEETEFIAQQLLGMGYRYYKPEYAQQLKQALKGSIYLDTDKTIMVSESLPTGGIVASSDWFEGDSTPMLHEPSVDVMLGKYVVFPRSMDEARNVIASLKKSGARIDSAEKPAFGFSSRAVRYGLLVKEGVIGFAPSSDDLAGAKIVQASDLGVGQPAHLSAEQSAMHAAFNEMAARMEQMSQRLARLEEEVLPKTLTKGKIAGPAGGRP